MPRADVWFSTSEGLIEALGPHGQQYARQSQFERFLNLSYVDPMLATRDLKNAYHEAAKAQANAEREEAAGRHEINLKDLLVQYLRHVHPIIEYQARAQHWTVENSQLDDNLLNIFDKKTMKWLQRKNWDVRNFMNWTWILTADTSERAATRLTTITHGELVQPDDGAPVPQSIFLFLLRRSDISSRALQPILVHAWEMMRQSERLMEISPFGKDQKHTAAFNTIVYDPRGHVRGMGESIFMIMIIRLLRTARRVWPAACENIVALICRYLDGINFEKRSSPSAALDDSETARLTYKYNTILKLLALPSDRHPFLSAIFQQRAQFSILRRMNRFEPPLIVDKRGYQAVVSMQLMHKKTVKEREWAHMKAKSWPPWKEEKLGIDARIGVEDGISRAKEALSRAREAGYGPDEWDAAAEVLAGWDTDGSPTIQTRTYLQRPSRKHDTARKNSGEIREDNELVWTARVRATRTLDEAWSCFLAYRDQTEVLSRSVYHEMLQRIIHDAQRRSRSRTSDVLDVFGNNQPMPGDGKEVRPSPESPKEATYVRTPPPDLDEFVGMMSKDKIKLSGRLLATVLSYAPSFGKGIGYLEASALSHLEVSTLLNPYRAGNPEQHPALKRIPLYLLGAWVGFLAKFAPSLPKHAGHDRFAIITTGVRLGQDQNQMEDPSIGHAVPDAQTKSQVENIGHPQGELINPLSRAFHLLTSQRPWYRPAWYHVLQALARPRTVTTTSSRFADKSHEGMRTWQLTCRLLDTMLDIDLAIDLDGFHILCTHVEKAIFAAERMTRGMEWARESSKEQKMLAQADRILSQGLPLIKEIFKNAVRSHGHQQELPTKVTDKDMEVDPRNEQETAHLEHDSVEDDEAHQVAERAAFLPPACLLPRLLELPHPAQLHAFIRILGLRRDYAGILDLIEWMSLFGDEINTIAEESMNGKSMMRRCLTAARVFLQRSWMNDSREPFAGNGGILIEAEAAPVEIVRVVEEVVMQNKQWGGWPTESEVDEYCMHGRFL